jgi:hypothetical protein
MICDEKKDITDEVWTVWRKKFEMGNLSILEIVQYFQKKSPLFARIETRDDNSIGKKISIFF